MVEFLKIQKSRKMKTAISNFINKKYLMRFVGTPKSSFFAIFEVLKKNDQDGPYLRRSDLSGNVCTKQMSEPPTEESISFGDFWHLFLADSSLIIILGMSYQIGNCHPIL